MKSFEFCFCFANRIVGSEVGFKFHDEQVEVRSPSGCNQIQ